MNLFILFHPSTRYSPETNLELLPKPAGRSFCCQRRDPVVRSRCSIAILAGNILIPCLLASQQRLTLPSRQTVQKAQQWLHLFKLFSSDIYLFGCIRNNELMRHDFAWHRKCAQSSGHCCAEELANNTANIITSN